MAQVSTIHLAHLPPTYTIHASLFTDLKNADFLRQQLLAGNTDFEYAFIDANSILSTTHLLAAAFRAINDHLANRLRSRNVHSETVFSLNPNNNIAASFSTFGITSSTTDLIALKISTPAAPVSAEAVAQHLGAHVEATSVPFDDAHIASATDIARIRKVYKLKDPAAAAAAKQKKGKLTNGEAVANGVGGDEQDASRTQRREIEVAVLALMALKGS